MGAAVRPATPDDLDAVLAAPAGMERGVYGDPGRRARCSPPTGPAPGTGSATGSPAASTVYGSVDSGGGFEVWVAPGLAIDEHGSRARPGDRGAPSRARSRPWSRSATGLCELLEHNGFRRPRRGARDGRRASPSAPRGRPAAGRAPASVRRGARRRRTCTRAWSRRSPGATSGSRPYEEWRPWLLGDPSYDSGARVRRRSRRRGRRHRPVLDRRLRRRTSPSVRRSEAAAWGRALLRAVFAEFARRGVSEVRLKVDAGNPTGAVRLYRRVGMDELRRYAVYVRGWLDFSDDSVRRRSRSGSSRRRESFVDVGAAFVAADSSAQTDPRLSRRRPARPEPGRDDLAHPAAVVDRADQHRGRRRRCACPSSRL